MPPLVGSEPFFSPVYACLVCSILFLRRKWLGQHTQSQEPHFVTKMNAHRRSFLSSSEKKPVQTNKRQWIEKKRVTIEDIKLEEEWIGADAQKHISGNNHSGDGCNGYYTTQQSRPPSCVWHLGKTWEQHTFANNNLSSQRRKKKPRAIVYFVFSPAITQLASSY